MNKENEIKKLLERGVEEIIEKEHLIKILGSGKKLRVKFGIDPTAPDLHLGHTVVLRKLKQFQELGHTAVLIIGDFTGQIGDPSGRTKTRVPLSEKEIKTNLKNYLKQAGKVLNLKKIEFRYNSKWFLKNPRLLLELMSAISMVHALDRDDFQKRIKSGGDVTLLETLYSGLQGYDSVAVKADVELGGTDQKFNLLMGRRMQRHYGMPEQDIVTMPLIEGTDGVRKMSKSYGNYISITEKPNEMFGKIMSIPDILIEKYFVALTDVDIPPHTDAYKAKILLAETIVGMYHSPAKAKKAKEEFWKVFSKKETPKEIQELRIKNNELELMELLLQAGLKSKSEARRLIGQNAVKIDGAVKNNSAEKIKIRGGEVLKIGKRTFYKLNVR